MVGCEAAETDQRWARVLSEGPLAGWIGQWGALGKNPPPCAMRLRLKMQR